MISKLESAEYVAAYRLRLRFADGRQGEVDLADELWGEVFEPLKDRSRPGARVSLREGGCPTRRSAAGRWADLRS